MVHREVQAQVDNLRQDATAFLQDLLRADSLAGNETKAQEIMSAHLTSLGFKVDMWAPSGTDLASNPNFYSPRTTFDNSPNVVGILSGSGGGRSLLLNGHIDVVPVGDLKTWDRDPFSGDFDGVRVHGRGASDMKGGLVAQLLAIQAIQKAGLRLKGDVIFECVIEEESGGAGTLAAIMRGYKADAALIAEPSEMKIFPQQQGSMWFKIQVKGKAAHGGTRYQGVSAIEKAFKVVTAVQQLETERNVAFKELPLYRNTPIPVPINLGKISGGEWPSSVPDLVILEGRMGVAPTEDMETAKQQMRDKLASLALEDDWFVSHPIDIQFFGARWLPGATELDDPLLQILQKSYESCLGSAPSVEASPWGTDGGALSNLAGVPSIVFGPGETKLAHQSNESIDMNDVIRCAVVTASAILEWCGYESN